MGTNSRKKHEEYNLLHMPKKIFRFYRYDRELNLKRLLGEMYLPSPLDFNDPCDCQRPVKNNLKDLNHEDEGLWVQGKLQELGFSPSDRDRLTKDLIAGTDLYLNEVHQRQLEKLGVICATTSSTEALMWGYYANYNGYCIEYDPRKIIVAAVIGYINVMDDELTKFFYETKGYNLDPNEKSVDRGADLINYANKIIGQSSLLKITNQYLNDQKSSIDKLNFIRNIFLKRIYARSVKYGVDPYEGEGTLFYDHNNEKSGLKYFKKTKNWNHEKEFRFIFSLGGRKVIQLGKDVVKALYLGCNMSIEKKYEMIVHIIKNDINCNLYTMLRFKNGGVRYKKIDLQKLKDQYHLIDKSWNW